MSHVARQVKLTNILSKNMYIAGTAKWNSDYVEYHELSRKKNLTIKMLTASNDEFYPILAIEHGNVAGVR